MKPLLKVGSRLCGSGSFGNVYKIEKDGKTYAVKMAKTEAVDTAKKAFTEEKQANEYLQANLSEEERKYFVDYHGGFEIDGKLVFITEFIEKLEDGKPANFNEYIKAVHKDGNCSKKDLNTVLRLLQQGFEKLAIEQRIGLVNRDTKPDNFMVNQDANGNLQLKGMDYGSAFAYASTNDDSYTKGLGSPAYMSPEVMMREPYSFATDVYSMGITLLEGILGEVFPKIDFRFPWQIMEYVVGGNLSKALEGGTFDQLVKNKVIDETNLNNLKQKFDEAQIGFLVNLVADCTAFDPQDRITAKQAAYLLEEFTKGEFSNYKDAKENAIKTYPKDIPEVIVNMISSEDDGTRDKGINALKRLIREDSSYIETKTFENLNKSVTDRVKQEALIDIMNKISEEANGNKRKLPKDQEKTGVCKLKNFIKVDPSCIETNLFKELEASAPPEVKEWGEYKSVFDKTEK